MLRARVVRATLYSVHGGNSQRGARTDACPLHSVERTPYDVEIANAKPRVTIIPSKNVCDNVRTEMRFVIQRYYLPPMLNELGSEGCLVFFWEGVTTKSKK